MKMTWTEQKEIHQVDFNNRLLEFVDIPAPARVPRLPVSPMEVEGTRDLFRRLGVRHPRPLLFHLGGRGERKRWAPERFAEVANTLCDEFGCDALVAAGPGESVALDRVEAFGLSTGCRVLREPLSLAQLYALLSECGLFIGNDSGPAHMAAAVGTPVLSLFGEARVLMWHTLGPEDRALQADMPCGEACLEPDDCAPGRRLCVGRIPVPAVLNAAREILVGLGLERECPSGGGLG